MPYPQEYQIATMVFTDFLGEVKTNASFQTRHMAYTAAQGVFNVFRRRLSLGDAIRFSNLLPAGIRALFVADWDPDEERKEFQEREKMLAEVSRLRPEHNFSFLTEDAIRDVARALRNHVDCEKLDTMLHTFPRGAVAFWEAD
ncbi:DUF2267 domain-containing protein [Desulfovibrio caledoniensis]